MWTGRNRQDRDRLNDYWNALNRSAPPEELARLAEPIEPATRAAIDRTRALHQRRRPDPAFAARLGTDLMNAFATTPAGTVPLPRQYPGPSNGRIEPRMPKWLPALPEYRKSRRWVLAQLATAALLIAALLGGYFWLDNRNEHPAVILQETPEATPTGAWTNLKGNAARTGEGNAGPVGQPIALWRFQAGAACEAPPAVLGGVVYAGCLDGYLYALESTNGEELWRFDTGGQIGNVTVTEDHVYVVSGSGALMAISLDDHQEAWRFDTPVWGTGVVDDGLLAVPAQNGWLVGLDAETGAERWRYYVTDRGTVEHPAIANGMVYAGGAGGGIVAVDAETGELRWRGDTGTTPTGSAVVAGGIAYIPELGGAAEAANLHAFDPVSGEPLWASAEPMTWPAVSDGIGYSGSSEGIVHAFDTATGEELWRVQVSVGGRAKPPVVAGGVVYAPGQGDQAVTVYALDAATGAELWRFELDGDVIFTGALSDGVMYLSTMAGSVYAIGGTDEDVIPAPGGQASPEASPAEPAAATPVAAQVDSPVELLWQTSGGPEPLIVGFDGAIGPDGNLWVIDACNNRFQIFDPDGTFLEFWGEFGSGPGQFNFCDGEPRGHFTFDAQGNLYVVDAYNSRIQKFDKERRFVTEWRDVGIDEGQFLDTSIAVNGEGNVVVCNMNRSDCQVYNPDGQLLFAFGEAILSRPAHVASDADGNVYVSDLGHSQVFKFDSDGTLLQTLGEPGFGPGQLFGPEDIAVDAAGNIYVAETDNGRVKVLDAQGNSLAEWNGSGTPAGRFSFLTGVTADVDGTLYVFDVTAEGSTVYKVRLLLPPGPEATPVAQRPHPNPSPAAGEGLFGVSHQPQGDVRLIAKIRSTGREKPGNTSPPSSVPDSLSTTGA
jgi:outer membrane protein assembly factor BamB